MNNALAMLRRHRAMLEAENGSWLGARATLDDIASQLREHPDSATQYELGRTLLDRATVLASANQWQGALEDLTECERLARAMAPEARHALLASVYGQRLQLRAASWSPVRDPVEARRALEGLRSTGASGWWVDEAGADLAYQERDWEGAERAYRQLERALEREGWRRGVAASRIRIGRCLLELGRLEDAREVLDLALGELMGTGARHLLASAHLQKARVLAALSDPEGAWGLARTALAIVESTVRRFRAVFDQHRYMLDGAECYEEALDIALACAGDAGTERAWAVAERAKSFRLCQLLANADIPRFDGVRAVDVARLRDLEAQLDVAEAALSRAGSSDAERARRAIHERRVDSLSRAKLELQERMVRSSPRWAALRVASAAEPVAALVELSPEWLPISYFWRSGREGSALHVFWRGADGRSRHAHDAWSGADLARLDQARSRLRGEVSPTSALVDEGLGTRLWPAPLQAELTSAKRLLLSPHGCLGGLPLHALRLSAGDLVIERCAVQYLPSLGLLPLRRTAEGAQAVPSDVVPLSGRASFPEARPFDAVLQLGAEALRTSELFARPLAARMVALSAGSLGRQGERRGAIDPSSDEWVGICLPLFYAGVGCVALSLWDANAPVAELVMKALRVSLQAGDSPARALQRAVSEARAEPAALWANWCVVGLPD